MEKIIPIKTPTEAVPVTMGIAGAKDRSIKIGDSVSLISIEAFRNFFSGLSTNAAMRILNTFSIPVIYIGKMGYFNKYTLEAVLNHMTQPNRKGFAMPGSSRKKQIQKKGPAKHVDITLSDDDKQALMHVTVNAGGSNGRKSTRRT